jgi:hypothetical protein
MIIDSTTDLTPFAGARVTIDHHRTARILDIRHCADSSFEELRNGVGGSCVEDPHGDCRGGSTAFWWPYGTDLSPAEPA